MKIHEYQGKELLKKFGVPVPRGTVARSIEEAYQAATELATPVVVVKAQIHAGGRGKGGGVKLAKSPEEAKKVAARDTRHEPDNASDRSRRPRSAGAAD